jgi:hypothetical protein
MSVLTSRADNGANIDAQRRKAEAIAAATGHELVWSDFECVQPRTAERSVLARDGWCTRGGRAHLRPLIYLDNGELAWQISDPAEQCPG